MRLFLDTSVLLAAAGSEGGAAIYIVTNAVAQGWTLVTADYCIGEVHRNLPKLASSAPSRWRQTIAPSLEITEVRLALDRAFCLPQDERPAGGDLSAGIGLQLAAHVG